MATRNDRIPWTLSDTFVPNSNKRIRYTALTGVVPSNSSFSVKGRYIPIVFVVLVPDSVGMYSFAPKLTK